MNEPTSGLTGPALAHLVHDARSQLRGVIVTAQLLQRREHSSAELQESLCKIVASGKHLDSLLTHSAHFGTLADAPRTLLRPISLSALLHGLLIEQRPLIESAGGELDLGEPPSGKVAAGLQWILRELVANSLRFRGSEPLRVRIELTATAHRLTVLVSDNGIGIPSEFADQVFQPYRRLHNQGAYPGFGLGLATARRIAEVCDGSIDIQPVDGGTTIQVQWPIDA